MASKTGTLKGPVGDQGVTGDTGTQGATGATGDPGIAGSTGPAGPIAVSTQSGNTARLGTDSKILVPPALPGLASTSQSGLLRQVSGNATDFIDGTNNSQALSLLTTPAITDIRLRTFNCLTNPNFEIDQYYAGNAAAAVNSTATHSQDRWYIEAGLGAGTWAGQQIVGPAILPSGRCMSANAGQAKINNVPAMTATSYFIFYQAIEGIRWREMDGQPHSISFLVRSSIVATFAVFLRDATNSNSWVAPCTITTPNVWQLFQLPNIPAWPVSNSVSPGIKACTMGFCLMAGSNFLTPTPNAWASGNYLAAAGISNSFASLNTFHFGFVQYEPLPVCSPFIEIDYMMNLRACQRYYSKSCKYGSQFPNSQWKQIAQYIGSTNVRSDAVFPVEMAVTPTISMADNVGTLSSIYIDSVPTTNIYATSGQPSNLDSRGFGFITLATAPGAWTVAHPPCLGQWRATTSGF